MYIIPLSRRTLGPKQKGGKQHQIVPQSQPIKRKVIWKRYFRSPAGQRLLTKFRSTKAIVFFPMERKDDTMRVKDVIDRNNKHQDNCKIIDAKKLTSHSL